MIKNQLFTAPYSYLPLDFDVKSVFMVAFHTHAAIAFNAAVPSTPQCLQRRSAFNAAVPSTPQWPQRRSLILKSTTGFQYIMDYGVEDTAVLSMEDNQPRTLWSVCCKNDVDFEFHPYRKP